MKAALVIQTANGFAVAPYSGPVPNGFVEGMSIATDLRGTYTASTDCVDGILRELFKDEPEAAVVHAVPAAPETVEG